MTLAGMRSQLAAIRKELAPNHKTLEELKKSNIHTLTDDELFRLITGDHPGKPLADMTDGELEAIVNGV